MDLITGMIFAAIVGLAGAAIIALSRSVAVPVATMGLGLAALVAIGVLRAAQPCTGDAAGCGMSRGFEALMLLTVGAGLIAGGIAAIGWRLAAGRDARMRARIIALVLSLLLLALIGAATMSAG